MLVHLAHRSQFNTGSLHNVVGGTVAHGMFEIVVFMDALAQSADIRPIHLGIRGDGGQMVFGLPALAARKAVVAAIVTGFRFQDQVATGQGVQQGVDQSGTGDHGTGNTEVGYTGGVALRGRHSTCGKRERKDNIGDRIDDHVSDNAAKALETFDVTAAQNGGLLDPDPELEPHHSVQTDRTELGQENPDVVRPETDRFVIFADPALEAQNLSCWPNSMAEVDLPRHLMG